VEKENLVARHDDQRARQGKKFNHRAGKEIKKGKMILMEEKAHALIG
jgi:hypothetical protein